MFPTRERPLKPYEAVLAATPETRREVAAAAPDVVVHDILTIAPALAAELEGVPVATLVPHVLPVSEPGFPPYAVGARLPRGRAGEALWRALERPAPARTRAGPRRAQRDACAARAAASGAPARRAQRRTVHRRDISPARVPTPVARLGATSSGRCCGSRRRATSACRPARTRSSLVATSTAQDPEHRMLRAALAGLAGERVRVLGTWNRRLPSAPVGARQRAARRMDVLRADDAGSCARRLPRRPRHARAGARLGLPGARRPPPRRHERERRAASTGREPGAGAVAVREPGHAPLGGAPGARGPRARPRAPAELAAWAREHDGARRAADWSRAFAGGFRT